MTIVSDRQWLTPILQQTDWIKHGKWCVLRGIRVVIPLQGRQKVLELLHDTHPGMEWMKGLARSYIWWPELDAEIEGKVKSGHACQHSRNKPEVAPLNNLEWPSNRGLEASYLDYARPFMNSMFLIIADVHTVISHDVTSSPLTPITIEKLSYYEWLFW